MHETTEDGESLLSLACSAGYYELAQVRLFSQFFSPDETIVLRIAQDWPLQVYWSGACLCGYESSQESTLYILCMARMVPKVKFWSRPLRVVWVVPLIPSQIPWFVKPGVADGAASGRFGLMRDIQWSWCALCRASFFPQGFITILSTLILPLADFSCNLFLEKKRKSLDVIFWHTFSQSRVVCMAGRSILCSCCAPSCPAHAPTFPSGLPSVQTLHSDTILHTTISLLTILLLLAGHNNPNLWQKLCSMPRSWRTFCTFCRKTAPWLYVEHCTVASWVWEV